MIETAAGAGFVHRVRVRYGDCDMQGVVFNANYVAYVDDAMDMWLQHALGEDYAENAEPLSGVLRLER